jgi:hypothetical protein
MKGGCSVRLRAASRWNSERSDTSSVAAGTSSGRSSRSFAGMERNNSEMEVTPQASSICRTSPGVCGW